MSLTWAGAVKQYRFPCDCVDSLLQLTLRSSTTVISHEGPESIVSGCFSAKQLQPLLNGPTHLQLVNFHTQGCPPERDERLR